uniref:Transmembrane protein n=1 Tax=Ascaris lumbricoides TaxID=6252 RepID=A0A0M3I2W9_ASCLU
MTRYGRLASASKTMPFEDAFLLLLKTEGIDCFYAAMNLIYILLGSFFFLLSFSSSLHIVAHMLNLDESSRNFYEGDTKGNILDEKCRCKEGGLWKGNASMLNIIACLLSLCGRMAEGLFRFGVSFNVCWCCSAIGSCNS